MISLIQNQSSYPFVNALVNRLIIAREFIVSKNEFVFQKRKVTQCHGEMVLTKKIALPGDKGGNKRADELIDAYNQSNKSEEFLKDYVRGLEEMMFMTHHKVRQPVANILGMASLIDKHSNSPEDLQKIAEYMRQSALSLEAFTRELTSFISDLEQKSKNKTNDSK